MTNKREQPKKYIVNLDNTTYAFDLSFTLASVNKKEFATRFTKEDAQLVVDHFSKVYSQPIIEEVAE